MINKKGAMFGLDARIALAIFGALSVISGAALYSAIQESKVVALYTEFQEIGKAYEQYYLDVGDDIAEHTADIYIKFVDLVNDPSVIGWNGPYINVELNPSYDHIYDHKQYGGVFIVHAKKIDGYAMLSCDAVDPCYIFIGSNSVP